MIKHTIFKSILGATLLISLGAFHSFAQVNELRRFAIEKNRQWQIQKHISDSIAEKKQLVKRWVGPNAQIIELIRFENGIPVYYQTENATAAATISTSLTWPGSGFVPALSGSGRIAGIWDAGYVLNNHIELSDGLTSRIFQHDEPSYLGIHATHLSGTMIATGVNAQSRGMANAGKIYAYDYNNDLAEMASEAADGLQVSNHSYGPLCGWSFNTSDEMWYWHGDVSISSTEDLKFGFYTETSRDMDFIAFHAPEYLIVKSAGNDHNDYPESQPVEHYIWEDSWKISATIHDPDGGLDGFDCLSPMAIAKNVLTVGAVGDLPEGYASASGVQIAPFSSWGPTDDGRIKPDLVANGVSVLSCGSEEDSYREVSGTSMAAASITGSILLLNELQDKLQPGVKLKSSTIKGLLIHTTDESGPAAGPDYQYGWGLANIYRAANLLKENYSSGGKNIIETALLQGEEITIQVTVPDDVTGLKATLCWTDPPGDISPNILNNPAAKLVNDINIEILETGTGRIYRPWILDPANPSAAANTGVNHVDNVEQVFISNPTSGTFTIRISHQDVLENAKQALSLIITGIETGESTFPAENLAYFTGSNEVNLLWHQGSSVSADRYNIYRNNNIIASTTETYYKDQSVQNGTLYQYHVTAVYPDGTESLPTNTIQARPLMPKAMPYTMNCEAGLEDWNVKAELSGWRLGDSDSLNCYYLDFSGNSGHLLGIDSYTAGDGVHVSDVAISPPINLAYYEKVTLSFDYMLVTGIYATTNDIKVMYRLNEASEWVTISTLSVALDWKHIQFSIPPEAAVAGVQLGFRYDDYYKRGMGAGLDNIQLAGTLNISEDLSLESINLPVSAMCIQDDPMDLSVTVKNTGNIIIPVGEILTIATQCNGIEKSKNYVLGENLTVGSSKMISFQGMIDPLPAGSYILNVNVSWSKDQNLSNNIKSKTIIINSLPEISFVDPPVNICANSGPVTIEASPTGGTLHGDYITGNQFDPIAAGVGEFQIIYSYEDNNNCANSDTITISVVPLPQVSFTGLSAEYCVDNPTTPLSGIPSGGNFTGPGVVGNIFSPALSGPGTHQIQYNYTDENTCTNTAIGQTVVHDTTLTSFVGLLELYCINSALVELAATPAGGTFSINGTTVEYLDPASFSPGPIDVMYDYTNDNGCTSILRKPVAILDLPDVAINEPGGAFCITETEIYLEAQPAGGIFSGDLATENLFSPLEAGVGLHEVIYSYVDGDGCQNSDTIILEVVALPAVSFTGLSAEYCVNEESSLLTGIPSGGTFTGDGMDGIFFNPELSGSGSSEVVYSYTDANGCVNSTTQSTFVNALTSVEIIDLSEEYCQDSDPITLFALPVGGVFYINNIENGLLTPTDYESGPIDITYNFTDENGCTSTDSAIVEIIALPVVSIVGLNELYCLIDNDYALIASPEGGYFSLNDQIITHINPMELGSGTFELSYEYSTSEGCTGTTTQSFEINPDFNVSIQGLAASYCPYSEDVLLAGTPEGGYFSGTGIFENSFSPGDLSPGTYQISYTYDLNGCDKSTVATTIITEAVEVAIAGLEPDYCPDDSLTGISGIPAGGMFEVKSVFEETSGKNTYDLYYTLTDQYNCTFIDSERFQVFKRPDYLPPVDLQLTKDEILTLGLTNTAIAYYWPNDSTSSEINIIGGEYDQGEHSFPVIIIDEHKCLSAYDIMFYVAGVTGTINANPNLDIKINPNPANSYLIIEFPAESPQEPMSITFFDLNGQWINHFEKVELSENKIWLDVSNLHAGIYFIAIFGQEVYDVNKISIAR